MCRLYGFLANEDTKVECTLVHAQNSLIMQSESDYLGRTHADGWGIAFYHDEIPELERRSTAAFQDLHFSATAERVYTRAVIAHVRLASVGVPDVRNAHPFVFGHWSFAHNGTVTGFESLESQLLQEVDPDLRPYRQGQTDSELLFLWLLSHLKKEGVDLNGSPVVNDVADMVGAAISSLAARSEASGAVKPAKLNTVLTNGHIMVATRWNNDLYVVHRHGIHDCEICGIPHVHHHKNIDYQAVVLASEPISDELWVQVPDQSVVSVSDSIELKIEALSQKHTGTAAL